MPNEQKQEQEKKIFFRLSPELSDGDSHVIVKNKEEVVKAIEAWCDIVKDEYDESCEISTILMSEKEFKDLKEL